MTRLQPYINEQQQQIENALGAIADLQKQLGELQQQVRVQQQVNQAQQTAEKEVKDWINQGKKLFKDLCGVFPKEALQDLVNEIDTLATEVSQSYEQYATSERFLQGAEEEEEAKPSVDMKELPLIVEPMPSEDDNKTILNAAQIEQIIAENDEAVLEELKQRFNIQRVRTVQGLAKKLEELKITRRKLQDCLTLCQQIASTPLFSLNGDR
jgi:DNA-directed RNA polymerase sigma subunit (sigma70/sigma32)